MRGPLLGSFCKVIARMDSSRYLSQSLICGLGVGSDRASVGLEIESWQDLLAAPDRWLGLGKRKIAT